MIDDKRRITFGYVNSDNQIEAKIPLDGVEIEEGVKLGLYSPLSKCNPLTKLKMGRIWYLVFVVIWNELV